MRIFKSKWLAKFARKNGLSDEVLRSAAKEVEAGNFDADLGGYVYKQRIARQGEGKRGGYRTIVFSKQDKRMVFVYGFAKNNLDNIEEDELKGYKKEAQDFMNLTDEKLLEWCERGSLIEIVQEA